MPIKDCEQTKDIMQKYLLFLFLFSLISCLEATKVARTPQGASTTEEAGSGSNNDGNGAVGGSTPLGEDVGETQPQVELRHLIEPQVDNLSNSGTFRRKLTIPKNYNDFLYVAGLNLQSLTEQNLQVRFNFGLNTTSKTIQATIAAASPGGLTETSAVEVLVLDLRSEPFRDLALLYELYDYNEYDFDGTGNDPGALAEPVSFNRNEGLFCRGLDLKDDPTFDGNASSECSGVNDVCKYTYAKVLDKGLVALDPIFPSERSIESGNNGLYGDTNEVKLKRCLPDNPFAGTEAYRFDQIIDAFLDFGDTRTINNTAYTYQGPYFPSNVDAWQIKSEALVGKYGVFGAISDQDLDGMVDVDEIEFGYRSKLFPLYVRYDLPAGAEYLGSVVPSGVKVPLQLSNNGQSDWLDGCNARANTKKSSGEHIGSCTVTSTIQLIATDSLGQETVIDITDEVKLQIVGRSTLNTDGEDILATNFNQCSSTNQCGSDSCCINKRCWSRDLVGQCIEDLPSFGNQITGESCNSDFQCASLCCNGSTGRCAPHETTSANPTFCSKATGDTCVADDWCGKSPVRTCAIVRTGSDVNGGVTCAVQCVTREVFGSCTSSNGTNQGICIAPVAPADIVFSESDPNRCLEAISRSELEECANNPEQCSL